MNDTAVRVEHIETITRAEAGRLAATEHQRCLEQLRSLSEDDWRRPTDCPAWDVRAVGGHVVGMAETFTGFRTLLGQMRAAGKAAKGAGAPMIDCLTERQVAAHAALTTGELLAKYADVGPRSVAFRAKAPALFRRMPMTEEVGGQKETWRMGFLLDTILTRDPWMHRVDIAHATGRPLVLTAEHDGRIVADAVAEWSRRHGQPFILTLDGPAGGTYISGGGGEALHLDAVELCRTMSGRAQGLGLLAQAVPF